MKCEICQKEYNSYNALSKHLTKHNISKQEYYDKYLKSDENDGKCVVCRMSDAFH